MILSNNPPRRAVRTMYVQFIYIEDGWVKFDLWFARRQLTFHVAVDINEASIQAFTDPDGGLTRLFELQGGTAQFYVDGFTSDGCFGLSCLRRIKKVVAK